MLAICQFCIFYLIALLTKPSNLQLLLLLQMLWSGFPKPTSKFVLTKTKQNKKHLVLHLWYY